MNINSVPKTLNLKFKKKHSKERPRLRWKQHVRKCNLTQKKEKNGEKTCGGNLGGQRHWITHSQL
jgi:signal recognition particle subunit SEC65